MQCTEQPSTTFAGKPFKKNPDVEEACWSTLYGIINIVAFAALLHFGGKCS